MMVPRAVRLQRESREQAERELLAGWRERWVAGFSLAEHQYSGTQSGQNAGGEHDRPGAN